ncbi:gamma-glutamyltransferase [Nocardioides sp.]|uniref:gamma-glutamyltransferase n=1 Tax=Nocardioides sp. TaxID=35761 RepID=UPI0027330164|nr:gamma-glutamyltransferase [Nocardioides sp.]MDP3890558.1 gamma-glutamyltransferase [Nocardioides sp.]
MKIGSRTIAAGAALALTAGLTATTAGPATAGPEPRSTGAPVGVQQTDARPKQPGKPGKTPPKDATASGYGGAVSTVDEHATAVGLEVLRKGGNATDAAVAAAAALGVTEPYSAGIGGGGYFVHYDAATGEVETIDGRETAPASMPTDAFIDPETGSPYRFSPEMVTSGASVGVPGTPATWEAALEEWGTWSYKEALRPATKLARKGFVVDETFRSQTLDNAERFAAFTSTSELFLPGGDAPEVGSTFRNPDLAATYRLLATKGNDAFYGGPLAADMVAATQEPPTTDDTELPVPPGFLELEDLAGYDVVMRAPTRVGYRGYDVYGMPPSSSGGTTVGEALNILEQYDLSAMTDVDALHHYLEAGALAFADRGAYLGDPAYVDVPVAELLDDTFAAERACAIDPEQAMPKPAAAGDVTDYDGQCDAGAAEGQEATDTESESTTNLTVADRWGNVVEYTLTIEQTGGSGIVVPGRGFILNNELTDFSHVYDEADPNRIEPGKRPRSSMSPTIVLEDGQPFLALGTPGGSTIITTVLQMIVNRIDLGMSVEESIAAPRSSPRNGARVTSEPAFIEAYGDGLAALGHSLVPAGDALTSAARIGAATAIEFGPDGLLTAVAEPERRGGGAAAVVDPR